MKKLLTAAEYLSHKYELPEKFPELPLPDEEFISRWAEKENSGVLQFLRQEFDLPTENFDWKNISALKIEIRQTSAGRLPVISTANHDDFCQTAALMTAGKPEKYPLTVNAFTIRCKAEKIFRHRVILLNAAPYSNISADKMNLTEDDWLKKSFLIRLRHESAHYETLRLFGGMRNHALDEILADCLGQIAAFGNFDADRQRIFFGLENGGEKCTGRLSFYCRNVLPEELPKIYRAVDKYLDEVESVTKKFSDEFRIFKILASRPIPAAEFFFAN